MGRSKQKGLTIIEVLIVLLIVGILVIALTPVLNNYIIRSNRSDAIKSLSAMQVNQEKWRLNSTSYGSTAQVWTGSTSFGGYYTMSATGTPTGYTLTATAGSAQSADTGCTTMTITYANNTTTNGPSAYCWQ